MATYTSNYAWTKPGGNDQVDISVLNGNLDSQDAIMHKAFTNMAQAFSATSTYAVGDIVLYDNVLYKCHTAVVTPGSWTGSTNWQVYKLSEGGGGGTSNYNDLTNKPSINGVTLSGNKTTRDLGLQDKLTFDNTPTDGSNNPVKSDGIYDSEKDIYAVMGKMGAKNLIPYPYYDTTKNVNGITFTDNGDGTITVKTTENGATADAAFFFCKRNNRDVSISPGRYTLTGTPNGGSTSTYSIQVSSYIHGTTTNGQWWSDAGTGTTKQTNDLLDISVYIQIKTGTVITTPITFKPMLRLASDTDDTYQPYAKTNRELTESYPANKVMMSDGVTSVEDALDTTLATIEGTAHTVASGASHTESIPITYPTGYTRAIGVMGFYLGNSVLTPWQIEISGDNVTVSVFNHYTNSANAKTRLTLLFAK